VKDSWKQRLIKWVIEPSEKHERYGSRIAPMLDQEGWNIGKEVPSAIL
jgi:hypothetical protein